MVATKTFALLLLSLFLAVGLGEKKEGHFSWKHNITQREARALELASQANRKEEEAVEPQSSPAKNPSDEDLLRDLLIQELLACLVDQTNLCRLR
uniref:Uncharacterized protein n=1 Tax=Pan paniscus TaxID=9597 RepID=A0A2R9A756_PANPA